MEPFVGHLTSVKVGAYRWPRYRACVFLHGRRTLMTKRTSVPTRRLFLAPLRAMESEAKARSPH